ncbi:MULTISPECIES: substrate-binding domain-containing protein [Hyphomicrobiales]|jgi:molybdate transport system substrate-binding protein|uniref:substrate-binding domain-containing protein n=1 Tax=Methylobacterium sp. CCH7-A2 TaxID=1768789 RepID=UPI000835C737|nr:MULTISPECIES: substrate-binding domain-containing protein [Hyphomicrobiales]
MTKDRTAFIAASALLCAQPAFADVHVISSGGFTAAYKELVPACELKIGQKVVSAYGASMGAAPDAIPNRLARGEPADVVILAGEAFDKLVEDGKGMAGTRTDLARSAIGLSVKAGAPKPDISTVEALKKTLMEAKSIAYSASASGTYLSEELFPKLDPSGKVMAKARKIFSERVGTIVARGEAELGFQQVSELIPIEGLDFVGTLPEEVQRVTVFSAGLAAGAKETEAAKALIACLGGVDAAETIRKTGLDPVSAKR